MFKHPQSSQKCMSKLQCSINPKANAGEGVKEGTLDTAGKSINKATTIVASRKAPPKLETTII